MLLVFEYGYSMDGLEDLTPEECIQICRSDQGTDLIIRFDNSKFLNLVI